MLALFPFLSLLLIVDQSMANQNTREDPSVTCVSSFAITVRKCRYELDNDTKKYGEGGDARTCCIAAKFTHCVESQSKKECEADPAVISTKFAVMSQIQNILKTQNCGRYGKYPSPACYLYFNKLYFVIGGFGLVVLFAGVCIGMAIKRQKRTAL